MCDGEAGLEDTCEEEGGGRRADDGSLVFRIRFRQRAGGTKADSAIAQEHQTYHRQEKYL